jgi:hypothetical protein
MTNSSTHSQPSGSEATTETGLPVTVEETESTDAHSPLKRGRDEGREHLTEDNCIDENSTNDGDDHNDVARDNSGFDAAACSTSIDGGESEALPQSPTKRVHRTSSGCSDDSEDHSRDSDHGNDPSDDYAEAASEDPVESNPLS